jgi:hypothetical protein
MVDMNGVEAGLVVQNLLIATQALGLGGHPFAGGKGRVTMGGEEHWRAVGGSGPAGSLGFTFHRVPDDAPVGGGQSIPVGLSRIFEGYVPPFHATIEEAVDAVASLRSSNRGLTPWRDGSIVAEIPTPRRRRSPRRSCSPPTSGTATGAFRPRSIPS